MYNIIYKHARDYFVCIVYKHACGQFRLDTAPLNRACIKRARSVFILYKHLTLVTHHYKNSLRSFYNQKYTRFARVLLKRTRLERVLLRCVLRVYIAYTVTTTLTTRHHYTSAMKACIVYLTSAHHWSESTTYVLTRGTRRSFSKESRAASATGSLKFTRLVSRFETYNFTRLVSRFENYKFTRRVVLLLQYIVGH